MRKSLVPGTSARGGADGSAPPGVPCSVPQPRFLLGLSLCSLERANTVYLREGTGSLDTRPSFSLELVRDLENPLSAFAGASLNRAEAALLVT